jgi:gluconokinase
MVKKKIIFIMGVSGSGKSTVGSGLAKALGRPFFDGDDFHPATNIKKMKRGEPLNDGDREGWLQTLNQLALQHLQYGAIIGCSALKSSYRDILRHGLGASYKFVYLEGSSQLIHERMRLRSNHFMPPELLSSQFKILQPPKDALTVTIDKTPEDIVNHILLGLQK